MRRVNLIPMAGAGKRFVDAGYTVPKPLIEVGGVPMVVLASRSLPAADHWIFICQLRDVVTYALDDLLLEHFPGADVLTIEGLTEGQASTCLVARSRLQPDDALTIGACDNAMVWAGDAFDGDRAEADALIWTFRNNPVVERNPSAYGWVAVDAEGRVDRVSCKVPISDEPQRDHAVIGAFTFRRADTFFHCVESMVANDRRLNGEFYMDVALDECVRLGYDVRPLEVDEYVCWGTPDDYEANRDWRG